MSARSVFDRPDRRLASSAASSIAIEVPEPTEKWAVCAASPSMTTRGVDQRSLQTSAKLNKCDPLPIRRAPCRSLANVFWQKRNSLSSVHPDGQVSSALKPAARHTRSGASTRKVLSEAEYGYTWAPNRPCGLSASRNVMQAKGRSAPNHAYRLVP